MFHGLNIVCGVLSPLDPAVPVFFQGVLHCVGEAHGCTVGNCHGHLCDPGAELIKPCGFVLALIKISREASGYVIGGVGEWEEVHHFTMSSIVSVVHTPVYNNAASADHWNDDLLRGGTEVRGPAVNEGYFYDSQNCCHSPLEMFERGIVSHCRDTSCIEQSGDVGRKIGAAHNFYCVIENHFFVDGLVNSQGTSAFLGGLLSGGSATRPCGCPVAANVPFFRPSSGSVLIFHHLTHGSDNLGNFVLLSFFVGVASGIGPGAVTLLGLLPFSTSRRVRGFSLLSLLVLGWPPA